MNMDDLGSLDDIPSQLGDILMATPSQGTTMDPMMEDPQSAIPPTSQVFVIYFFFTGKDSS